MANEERPIVYHFDLRSMEPERRAQIIGRIKQELIAKGYYDRKILVEDLYRNVMKKKPEAFKLSITISTKDLDDSGKEILKKYGRTKSDITRDVIVPSDITLSSLHGVIQKAFGWQNHHPHYFRFMDETFHWVTEDDESVFADFCGIYFQTPLNENQNKNVLLERLPIINLIIPVGYYMHHNIVSKVNRRLKKQETCTEILPTYQITDELVYVYEEQENWEAHIKMTGCFYALENDIFNEKNELVKEPDKEQIAITIATKKPTCVAADGLALIDDVGGIHGYLEFLQKKDELEEFAKAHNWTAIKKRPQNLM